jgi:hypothetical protein
VSDNATAPQYPHPGTFGEHLAQNAASFAPPKTAGTTTIVELRDDEIAALVVALEDRPDGEHDNLMRKVSGVIKYANEADEYARLTLLDRRLKAERAALAKRLAALEETILEGMAEDGLSAIKHDATGKTIARDDKLWAKYRYMGEKPTDSERRLAGDVLINAGLDQYVVPGFNSNSVSAHFRETWKQIKADNDALPEHERRVLPDPNTLLPEAMQGVWTLDVTPKLIVR